MKHTTIRNEKLFCTHCGGEFALKYPIPIKQMNEKIDAFNAVHVDCKKTWTEPKVSADLSINEKATWWLVNGETGASSKTMYNCLIGNKDYAINHPYDPDDFKRCYKLLNTVPEWKNDMHKLRQLSPVWSSLVDNWDTLTEMYELNEKTNWKNCKQIGMYEFMQKILSQAHK